MSKFEGFQKFAFSILTPSATTQQVYIVLILEDCFENSSNKEGNEARVVS